MKKIALGATLFALAFAARCFASAAGWLTAEVRVKSGPTGWKISAPTKGLLEIFSYATSNADHDWSKLPGGGYAGSKKLNEGIQGKGVPEYVDSKEHYCLCSAGIHTVDKDDSRGCRSPEDAAKCYSPDQGPALKITNESRGGWDGFWYSKKSVDSIEIGFVADAGPHWLFVVYDVGAFGMPLKDCADPYLGMYMDIAKSLTPSAPKKAGTTSDAKASQSENKPAPPSEGEREIPLLR